ncbi:MAG: M1 family aminopeptidase [Caldilineaceae bacterium]
MNSLRHGELRRIEFFQHQLRLSVSDPFNEPGIEKQYPPDLELEPQHVEIDLSLDIPAASATGRVTTTVQARHAGADSLILHAVDFQDVAVTSGNAQTIQWRYDGTQFTIHWQNGFAAGEQRTVTIAYRVVKPTAGLYFSYPDTQYPNAPTYAATDHETERARYWLPCVDLPNVRTTLDIRLRSKAEHTILANGYLVGETAQGDGSKSVHWRLEQRCPSYLICFAVGDFTAADDGVFIDPHDGKTIPLAYYCSRDHRSADLIRTFGRSGKMLEWMTRKLDLAFPFPKYYQFALPGITGAMENISLVSWDEKYVQNESLHTEYGWLVDQVNVHEMSHSYFGDAIVCRDFAHAWLKESWATYVEQLWREDNYSQAEADYVYYSNATEYFEESDTEYSRPIITRNFRSSWDMYDRHLYEGGACRLHTLRCELGDEIFWAAVRDYLKRYNGKVVESDDFRLVLEEHSGRSLGRFFDQWFTTAGYPDLAVKFEYDAKKKEATFEIEQKQCKSGKPAFQLRCDLGWTLDGEEFRQAIKLDQPRHIFIIPIEREPQMVRFDPGIKALHKLSFNPGDEKLLRQLVAAPDVIGRIQAAYELAQSGKLANLQAIINAYANEPFWGVRREMANALTTAKAELAIAGLAQWIANERDPMVMQVLFAAAGKYRDQRLADALTARIQAGLPEMARGAAYAALGAQRQMASLELLLDAAATVSENGIAQQGALRGLAESRRAEAVEPLLARLPYGNTSLYARATVPLAIGSIGVGTEKAVRERIIDALVDALRDPADRLARNAASALTTMRVTQAIPEIEALARRLNLQQRVEVERTIRVLRQQDKLDDSALKKQVEELAEKVRRLEDQIQRIQAEAATR